MKIVAATALGLCSLALAGCGSGSGSGTKLGAATGNTLNEAQIDAALGPMNQASVKSTMDGNTVTSDNAASKEKKRP